MKAIDISKVHDFIAKSDFKLPKEEQTTFKVKFLTALQQAEIRDQTYKAHGIGNKRSERFLTGTAELEAIRHGLVGWENFKDESGKDVPFETGKDKKDLMISYLPPDVRAEMSSFIRQESEVTEGEE